MPTERRGGEGLNTVHINMPTQGRRKQGVKHGAYQHAHTGEEEARG